MERLKNASLWRNLDKFPHLSHNYSVNHHTLGHPSFLLLVCDSQKLRSINVLYWNNL